MRPAIIILDQPPEKSSRAAEQPMNRQPPTNPHQKQCNTQFVLSLIRISTLSIYYIIIIIIIIYNIIIVIIIVDIGQQLLAYGRLWQFLNLWAAKKNDALITKISRSTILAPLYNQMFTYKATIFKR